ncbi:hNH endonuclease [Enterobacter kobei]
MKLTLKEMNGLLNGKCLPSDLIVGETLAEYLVRKFADLEQKLAVSQREFRAADATIENLQMQVEKLAAENAGLKAAVTSQIELRAEIKKAGRPPHADFWVQSICEAEEKVKRALEDTPATDAFLAEVRASAIDSLVDIKTKQLADMHPDTHAFGATAMSIRSQINELQVFAAQLRKGVQS